MKTEPNANAFPDPGGGKGLTKREYFAAQCLIGMQFMSGNMAMLENFRQAAMKKGMDIDTYVAAHCVEQADFLIEALNAPTKN